MDPVERNDQSFIFLLETDGGTPLTLRLHPTLITDFQARLAGRACPADRGTDAAAQPAPRNGQQLGPRGGFLEIPLGAAG